MPAAAETGLAPPALGDPEAWVDDHGDALLRYALVRVGDRATAEDLVQETLLAAWRSRDRFDGACQPRSWFVAILKRRVADHFRRNGRRLAAQPLPAAADPVPEGPGVACQAESAEFWSVLTGCAAEMPEHLERAFRLRTFADEAPQAICDAEGISRKNLSVRLHRARLLLRRCLESRWFGGDQGGPGEQP